MIITSLCTILLANVVLGVLAGVIAFLMIKFDCKKEESL